ncbi:OLC1v1003213C1 [Oldenlandia corymbosa var. corymbosa]|uniref:OLC1v1003213C1 n=1 Tax=Oldenlandia corymbosa var. corymbosa TaxID=529605 RepID=A0AAV1DAC1_OLDCO|nr:OLC1v1003213C1 [Oldenlandia corymbosa var. corymbosa]
MSAVYDNWGRLVGAVLRREDFRQSALRTPSDVSLASSLPSSLSPSSSFNFISPSENHRESKLSSVGESFTYSQILQVTNNFSTENGLSGDLFYGVLEGGTKVVVKKVDLSPPQNDQFSAQQKMSFLNSEMEFYAKVSHPKFVPLLGYCVDDSNHHFLVYKYMPNKDLTACFDKETDTADCPSTLLDWSSRLKVAKGIAQALFHLHHECVPPLVHRNVEAGSILIDENYDGYLGRNTEVCTQKKDRNQSRISKLLRLPMGSKQAASDATCAYDVYCFGKVLLQLVTGMPIFTNNKNSRAPKLREDILPYITTYDKDLFLNVMNPPLAMDEHLLNELWAVAVVAKACLSSTPSKRPLMKDVLKALEISKMEDFSASVGSPSSIGQLTQVVPALEKTKISGGSESAIDGMSQMTTDAMNWTNLPIRQHLSASINEEAYRNGEIWASPNLIVFRFAELKTATKNFASDGLLGEGGFGKVYKGYLPKKYASNSDRQSLIAVKRLKPESLQGFQEWLTVITMLGKRSHPNFIKLYGYCFEDKELLLVYEYMPRGSLNNHLYGRGSVIHPLSWDIRLKILIGAARALAYLHALKREIIFRDFKAASILLDSSYNAKLSDFGLAKTVPPEHDTHVTTRVMGTYGYAAPEYLATGHLYVKSDVYGFGVVMLEVLTGLRALDVNRPSGQNFLADWIKRHLSVSRKINTIIDSRLQGKYPAQDAVKVVQLALKCLSSQPKARPSMKEVVQTLEQIESFR